MNTFGKDFCERIANIYCDYEYFYTLGAYSCGNNTCGAFGDRLTNISDGNKRTERDHQDNVRWEAVLQDDKGESVQGQISFEPVAGFPKELSEPYITNIFVKGDNVQVTRASVYYDDGEEPFIKRKRSDDHKLPLGIKKVNSNSRLFDMDVAAVTFSESENSSDDLGETFSHPFHDVELFDDWSNVEVQAHRKSGGGDRKTRDFDLTQDDKPETPILTNFVADMERELQVPKTNLDWLKENEKKLDSSNSLDIEKELNDLMGTLRIDFEGRDRRSFLKEIEAYENLPDYYYRDLPYDERDKDASEGSRINLSFVSTESECDVPGAKRESVESAESYWRNQRAKSKSFTDKYKFGKLLRRGRQRMSMIELGHKTRGLMRKRPYVAEPYSSSSEQSNDTQLILQAEQPHFVRLAYDRSSVIEPKVSSVVSLPPRPQSALEVAYSEEPLSVITPGGNSTSSQSRLTSPRISEGFDECIDWSWLEEAMKNLNSEIQECKAHTLNKNPSLRVDAECQTQLDKSWHGEEERVRTTATTARVSDAAVGLASECRIHGGEARDEDMPHKPFVEGTGVSTWLRQSMRRIRHFNLDDPPRVRSAPPDSYRAENTESEVIVNPVVPNEVRSAGSEIAQQISRPRTEESRHQRRRHRPRPTSAPARRSANDAVPSQQQQQQFVTETGSSAPSSEAQDNLGYESESTDRQPSPRGRRQHGGDEETEEGDSRSPLGSWPHGLSSVFAGLGCTLGLFNISRFAVLSVHFGSNFILQFLILSLVMGIPLLAFHAALGQTLGAGPVDMWKISPLFQGIGIALLLAQALIGMYSIVGVSWMFVYFRDSFITKQDTFRWAEPFRHYREDNIFMTLLNHSGRLEETVPDYLNGVVFQRHGLVSSENAFGHLKFQLTFNLAVVWMIVFVSLSKGLRSYGKVVYVFSVVPVLGVLVISSKLLGLTPLHRGFFPQTEWSEFFLNDRSWVSAGTEVMLTWNLLGAATMQVTSHNRSSKKLWRDVATIIFLTLIVLILAAFLGNMCHQIIMLKGYSYVPSSFERISTYSFLRPSTAPLPPSFAMPIRHMPHISLVAGDRVIKPGAIHESGYQVIRLATELVPATLAILGGNYLSPFWAVLFYFTLILFGIAQQLAIWHCVITGIMAINAPTLKSWETTITFFTCAAGFILGLPMTTELGIFVVYFLDYCLGGGWWIILLTLMEISAVLMIRGRPFSGENISLALFGKATSGFSLWIVPLLTFTWNVIMPVALLVVLIITFKSGGYRDLWVWKCGKGDYWPLWTREVGVFVQIIPLLCIPVVGLVQCYRYLAKGPDDIFDRLTNLYRPTIGISGLTEEENTANSSSVPPANTGTNGVAELLPSEDPPPKYTPPPSYSTATGTRIAKLLRQSFRRSIRRIQTVLGPELLQPPRPPPPDYSSVLVEMNQSPVDQRESSAVGANAYTAADVAQILRCSFRRTNNANAEPLHNRPTPVADSPVTPQNLVIPLQRPQ